MRSFGDSSRALRGADLFLLLTVVGLVLFGLIMVYSSSFIFAQERTGDGFAFIKKQIAFALTGFFALAFAQRLDYRRWARWSYWILFGITALLMLVMVPGVGSKVMGAQRWIRFGFFQMQPAELAKFCLILFAARQLDRKSDRIQSFTGGVLAQVVLVLPALALLLMQPDFGSAVIITLVLFSLMFVAGARVLYLGGAAAGAGLLSVAMIMSSPYRQARLFAYLDPWKDPMGKGFQILQSLVGLNNGQITGVGLGNGKEKLFYLPEAHNDFIFAVIGEELGFIGVSIVAVAFTYFVYRGIRIGWNCLNERGDRFGFLLATGIALMIGLQAFVNMCVVLGLLPTKGLSLPFISYGGSGLVTNLFAVGVLLSISRGTRAPRKDAEPAHPAEA